MLLITVKVKRLSGPCKIYFGGGGLGGISDFYSPIVLSGIRY